MNSCRFTGAAVTGASRERYPSGVGREHMPQMALKSISGGQHFSAFAQTASRVHFTVASKRCGCQSAAANLNDAGREHCRHSRHCHQPPEEYVFPSAASS
eukprot:2075586-Amphidinium_carterae.3